MCAAGTCQPRSNLSAAHTSDHTLASTSCEHQRCAVKLRSELGAKNRDESSFDEHRRSVAKTIANVVMAALLIDPASAQGYKDLFELRSSFVHGRAGLQNVSTSMRLRARSLARRAAIFRDFLRRHSRTSRAGNVSRPRVPRQRGERAARRGAGPSWSVTTSPTAMVAAFSFNLGHGRGNLGRPTGVKWRAYSHRGRKPRFVLKNVTNNLDQMQ